jgi:hypothetical protein
MSADNSDSATDEAMLEALRDFLKAVGKPAEPGPVKDPEGVQEALDRMDWLGGGSVVKWLLLAAIPPAMFIVAFWPVRKR